MTSFHWVKFIVQQDWSRASYTQLGSRALPQSCTLLLLRQENACLPLPSSRRPAWKDKLFSPTETCKTILDNEHLWPSEVWTIMAWVTQQAVWHCKHLNRKRLDIQRCTWSYFLFCKAQDRVQLTAKNVSPCYKVDILIILQLLQYSDHLP